ncbi:hypothetical protein AU693_003621 [Salmonella enterica subsp. diarizonae]|nr:hypothetical protein [Salmonella enterica subsp. diarizonae]
MARRNYPRGAEFPSEQFVQVSIEKYFSHEGFCIDTSTHVDLICRDQESGDVIWQIEAKGKTSNPGLDFRTCLGQLVQRMTNERVNYGLAVPNIPQYINLINQTSAFAVERINITWILVDCDGSVSIGLPKVTSNEKVMEVKSRRIILKENFKRFTPGAPLHKKSYNKSPVRGARKYIWEWLDSFVIRENKIPSLENVLFEAKLRGGKWESTESKDLFSNLKIEYRYWIRYHSFYNHFSY